IRDARRLVGQVRYRLGASEQIGGTRCRTSGDLRVGFGLSAPRAIHGGPRTLGHDHHVELHGYAVELHGSSFRPISRSFLASDRSASHASTPSATKPSASAFATMFAST